MTGRDDEMLRCQGPRPAILLVCSDSSVAIGGWSVDAQLGYAERVHQSAYIAPVFDVGVLQD